jgi:hypothetical protein
MNGVSVFRYGLLIVLMVIGVTAMAEPDPEGSPARGLQVERTEGDSSLVLKEVNASLNLSPKGLWQIVLAYKIANNGVEPLSDYSVDLALESGGAMSQFRRQELAPGEVSAVKSLVLGSAVDTFAESGSDRIALIVRRAPPSPQCNPTTGQGSLEACNLFTSSDAAKAYCEQKCMARESTSVITCVPREIQNANGSSCTIYVPDCDCEPMLRDGLTTTESLDHGILFDLLSNPANLIQRNPPALESRDISP